MLYRKISHTFVRTTSVIFVHTFVCFRHAPRAFSPSPLPVMSHPSPSPSFVHSSRLALAFQLPETSRTHWGVPQASGLAVRTSKTNARGLRDVRFLVTRGSPGENWLIDGIYTIAIRAQYLHPTDLFFSRPSSKGSRAAHPRKRLITSMVSKIIKDCASRMNLPPGQFTTKSFKIGGITSLKTLGDSQSLLLSKMDHKSAASSAHYQRSQLSHRPGPPLLSSDQGPLAGGQLGYSTETYKIDLAFTAGLSSSSSSSSNLHPCKRVKSCPL
jgi:hypothetical protein